jgi:hypothetical protein
LNRFVLIKVKVKNVLAVLAALYLGVPVAGYAQNQSYPAGYFQFPIKPGQPNSLAGVLGDLRTNHFHGGLDIRTDQREGLPVYAAADGYVSKVAVQGTGYGNVIYLKHSNGMTTVYGHLQKFNEPLGTYVRQAQYMNKSFTVELFPEPGAISFKKGEVIALSGNTGGSAGPHLHFEIRDAADNFLNPLFFGFKEIKDNAPPYFVNVALRPMNIDSRVNKQFDRKVVKPVRGKDGIYALSKPVTGKGAIGVELQAYDAMTGTGFRYGLYCIDIKVDGKEIFAYNMEQFPNGAHRDYNNVIDYKTDLSTGVRFYRCYDPVGNAFNFYRTDSYKGQIQIKDTLEHDVTIKIYDAFQNSSTLTFKIKGEGEQEELPVYATEKFPEWLEMEENEDVLKISAQKLQSLTRFANFFTDRRRIQVSPNYYSGDDAIFLADLRNYLPDSVKVLNKVLDLNYRKRIPPKVVTAYKFDRGVVQFDSTSLFDTLNLRIKSSYNGLVINDEYTPLRSYIDVKFKPEQEVVNKGQSFIYRYGRGNYGFVGGVWEGDEIAFRTRELGSFTIQTDTIPPKVRLVEHSKNQISAYISDDKSGIGSFEALVNGEWVLMNYEYKKRYIWSEKLDSSVPFEGQLTLKVTDKTGNSTILQANIEEPVNKSKTRKK